MVVRVEPRARLPPADHQPPHHVQHNQEGLPQHPWRQPPSPSGDQWLYSSSRSSNLPDPVPLPTAPLIGPDREGHPDANLRVALLEGALLCPLWSVARTSACNCQLVQGGFKQGRRDSELCLVADAPAVPTTHTQPTRSSTGPSASRPSAASMPTSGRPSSCA